MIREYLSWGLFIVFMCFCGYWALTSKRPYYLKEKYTYNLPLKECYDKGGFIRTQRGDGIYYCVTDGSKP